MTSLFSDLSSPTDVMWHDEQTSEEAFLALFFRSKQSVLDNRRAHTPKEGAAPPNSELWWRICQRDTKICSYEYICDKKKGD